MDDSSAPLQAEIEPIAPEAARAAIEQAIIERLGANWQQSWLLVHESNFLVRLNQGDTNLDFQAGLLGGVEITERRAHPLQTSGRYVAWIILVTTIFIALAIAVVLRII